MKYLELIWAALLRRKMRCVLTLLSVMTAFLLFGLLDTVRSTFLGWGQSTAGYGRLITFAKTSPGAPLPLSLYGRISELAGVSDVDFAYIFRGTYQDAKKPVPIEAHTDALFNVSPELELSPSERAAFRQTRTGALAGETLAKKYGWKIGDKIPLKTSVVRQDGSDVWTFDIVGIYRFADPGLKVWERQLIINWEFLDQSRRSDNGTVTFYATKATNPDEADWLAQAIDAISTNSAHETKTQRDNELNADLVRQRGDLGYIVVLIMGSVFFALLLVTGHTMAHSVRERIPEIAVLKTIGFTGRKVLCLVLSESVFLLMLGGAVGLGVATIAVVGARSVLEDTLQFPMALVGSITWMRGLVLAASIGLIVGLFPALRGLRLRVVDGLSRR